jgi:hypothetical protein
MKKIVVFALSLAIFSCSSFDNSPKEKKINFHSSDMEHTIPYGSILTYQQKDITLGDIVVFDYYDRFLKEQLSVAMRVVGKSGDEIEINNGQIFLNGKNYLLPETSKLAYLGSFNTIQEMAKIGKYQYRKWSDQAAILFLTKKELNEIQSSQLVDSIKELRSDSNQIEEGIIHLRTSKYFNAYYFGPIIIPKIGDRIDEDVINASPSFLTESNLNEKISENYYFVVGR